VTALRPLPKTTASASTMTPRHLMLGAAAAMAAIAAGVRLRRSGDSGSPVPAAAQAQPPQSSHMPLPGAQRDVTTGRNEAPGGAREAGLAHAPLPSTNQRVAHAWCMLPMSPRQAQPSGTSAPWAPALTLPSEPPPRHTRHTRPPPFALLAPERTLQPASAAAAAAVGTKSGLRSSCAPRESMCTAGGPEAEPAAARAASAKLGSSNTTSTTASASGPPSAYATGAATGIGSAMWARLVPRRLCGERSQTLCRRTRRRAAERGGPRAAAAAYSKAKEARARRRTRGTISPVGPSDEASSRGVARAR